MGPADCFLHPLQFWHRLSASEMKEHSESSSKRSESSKENRSPSSHSANISSITSVDFSFLLNTQRRIPTPLPPPRSHNLGARWAAGTLRCSWGRGEGSTTELLEPNVCSPHAGRGVERLCSLSTLWDFLRFYHYNYNQTHTKYYYKCPVNFCECEVLKNTTYI